MLNLKWAYNLEWVTGGEISEKPSLWAIEISPHGQFKY